MKRIISIIGVLFLLLSLQGCMWQDVPSYTIEASEQLCNEHEGVYEITSKFSDDYKVRCNDGFFSYVNPPRKNI